MPAASTIAPARAKNGSKVLNGELVEMQGECYLQSDPARMYKVMRHDKKPCFAFKMMAAGRVTNARTGVPYGLRKHQAERRRFHRPVPVRQE